MRMRSMTAIVVAAVGAACAPHPAPPSEPSDRPVARGVPSFLRAPIPDPDSLRISADVRILHFTPPEIWADVSVLRRQVDHRDRPPPGRRPAAPEVVDLCILRVEAYRTGDGRARPAWRSPPEHADACASTDSARTAVAQHSPGEPRFRYLTSEILGDSLPAGRYRFALLLRLAGDTLRFHGDELYLISDTLPPILDRDALRYDVQTRIIGRAPRYLETVVTATNTGDRRVAFSFGNCALRLRAFRTPARDAEPIWRSELRIPPGFDDPRVCLLYLASVTIAPGESVSPREFQARIPLYEVLGDSLTDGRYHFTAELALVRESEAATDPPSQDPGDETLRFDAGTVLLTSAVEPLPEERTVDGILYRVHAKTDPEKPGMLRLTLMIANRTGRPVVLSGSGCASLYGYLDPARRDAWWSSGRPDLLVPGCPLAIPQVQLAPGESRAFQGGRFYPQIRDGGEGPRVYHLLTRVRMHTPSPLPYPLVLAAGEVQLPEPFGPAL